MIQIPTTDKNFIQNNTGTSIGNVAGSFNLDFYTNRGKVKVSPTTLQNLTTTGESALNGVPCAFKVFNGKWYAIAGQGTATKGIFYNTGLNPSSQFVLSTETGVPTTIQSSVSDMEIAYGTFSGNSDFLYVTTNTGSVYWLKSGATTWSNSFTALGGGAITTFLTSGTPHMMCAFNNRMYCTDGNTSIVSWDINNNVSLTGPYTINLASITQGGIYITWIKISQDTIFIGTTNTKNGKSYIHIWDGASTLSVTKTVKIDAVSTFSCVIKNDIPYVMDSNGYLLKYNGIAFVEVARLPLPKGIILYGADATTTIRAVHPNGMAIVRGRINILINTNMPEIQEYCPSGIWEYEEDASTNGLPSYSGHLYHKVSPSLTPANISTSDSLTDFGQWNLPLGDTYSGGVGALVEANTSAGQSTNNGNILFGSQYFSNASSPSAGTNYAIYTNDTNNLCEKRGLLVTPEMYATGDNKNTYIESIWDTIFIRYRKFLSNATYLQGGDGITAFYRSITDIPVDYTATWTGNQTFTIASDITSSYQAGDTIEILQGVGSGAIATIVSAVYANPNTTITVNIALSPVPSTTIKVRFTKWQLIGSTIGASSNLMQIKNQFIKMGLPINANDTRIQIKLSLRFQGNDEFEQMILLEKPQTTAN